jgi:hypothetical protein
MMESGCEIRCIGREWNVGMIEECVVVVVKAVVEIMLKVDDR